MIGVAISLAVCDCKSIPFSATRNRCNGGVTIWPSQSGLAKVLKSQEKNFLSLGFFPLEAISQCDGNSLTIASRFLLQFVSKKRGSQTLAIENRGDLRLRFLVLCAREAPVG